MSTGLKEFLQEQAAKHQAEAEKGKATVAEWRTAVTNLFAQIRSWLVESDPEKVIEIEEGEETINEPGLGRYLMPRLNLRVFGKWIGIIPKARKTMFSATPPQKSVPQRAEGRADMTDELVRYVLYRIRQDGKDLWLIEGLDIGGHTERTSPGAGRYMPGSEPRVFDQDAFERALMSYIQ